MLSACSRVVPEIYRSAERYKRQVWSQCQEGEVSCEAHKDPKQSSHIYLCGGYDVTVNGVCFVFICVVDVMSLLMGYILFLLV